MASQPHDVLGYLVPAYFCDIMVICLHIRKRYWQIAPFASLSLRLRLCALGLRRHIYLSNQKVAYMAGNAIPPQRAF